MSDKEDMDGKPDYAVSRTGGAAMTWGTTTENSKQEKILCYWKSPRKNIPHRVVIRCDGEIRKNTNADGDPAYPCAVLQIDYYIGALKKSVKIDAVTQSALVVWATSVDVTSAWDRERIALLEAFYAEGEVSSPGPCLRQYLGTAISVGIEGDTGAADARWIVPIPWNNSVEDDSFLFKIPDGARGVRFLDATSVDENTAIRVETMLTRILWTNTPDADSPAPVIQNECIPECGCTLDIPGGVSYLVVSFSEVEDITMASPFWLEWIMSPVSL